MGALDAWVSVVPPEKVLPVVVDFLGSPKASSEGKVIALHWSQTLLGTGKAERCLDSILKAAAVVSVDKAVEVREAATQLAAALTEVSCFQRALLRIMRTYQHHRPYRGVQSVMPTRGICKHSYINAQRATVLPSCRRKKYMLALFAIQSQITSQGKGIHLMESQCDLLT